MGRIHRLPIWLRLVLAIWVILATAWSGMILWATHEQRQTAVQQAGNLAESIHQITLAGLTGMMINGTIHRREVFLDQIRHSRDVRMLRVLRAPAVNGQYGPGRGGEDQPDAAEARVLATGKPYNRVEENGDELTMRVILPAVARADYLGKNCLSCHQVAEGTVLGAVSMTLSLDNVQASVHGFGWKIFSIAVLISLPLLAFIWAFIDQFVSRPLARMTAGLEHVASAGTGLEHDLPVHGRDEIGRATAAFNQVLGRFREMLAGERLAALVFDNTSECIMVSDSQGRVLRINRAFSETTGYGPEEIIGQNPKVLASGRHTPEFYRQFWGQLLRDGHWKGEIWNRRKNGDVYPEWLNVSAARDEHGHIEAFVSIFSDITERKRQEEVILRQATHDSLTQLPNRILFKDRLEQALAQRQRQPDSLVAVMLLDLDRFKIINDTLGHSVGDELLKQVARRIQGVLRASDTVARLGGDEFTVILPEIHDAAAATEVADKIVTTLGRIIHVEGHELVITTSIGIALAPQHGEDVDTLLKRADAAMYHVKDQGRNSHHLFGGDIEERPGLRLELESQLYSALERDEFIVYYQPQLDLGSNTAYGAEALIRWRHPIMGLVPPSDFIPVSEETGLIVPIGAWVVRTVCMQARAWSEQGLPPLLVAVNLSARQFQRGNVVQMVREALEYSGLPPERLELEITESLAMQNVDYSVETLRALADLGVQLAIDDFGTGYSSLAYLKKMPVNTLKIDRSFVRDLTLDADDAAIVSAVTHMAHSMGLKIIAEGVETEGQLQALRALGCDRAQGYLFSRPVPATDIPDFLARQSG